MSFFGFEQNDLLSKEKERFLRGEEPKEDLAVYTWGEESYDGLGDALLEGGDDLNDETFGSTGAVGKDFDFTQQTHPQAPARAPQSAAAHPHENRATPSAVPPEPAKGAEIPEASRQPSLWDEKSPFSVLSRSTHSHAARKLANGASASPAQHHAPSPGPAPAMQPGRTLEEIEAEMRARAREAQIAQVQVQTHVGSPSLLPVSGSPSLQSLQSSGSLGAVPVPSPGTLTQRQQILQEQQEQQSRWWQQQRNAPPRMHPQSQSPRFHQQQQQQQLIHQQQQQLLLQQQQQQQQHLREQQILDHQHAQQAMLREQALEQQAAQQALLREQALEQQLLAEREREHEQIMREQRYQRQLAQEVQLMELQEQARRGELERAIRSQRAAELQQQQALQARYLQQQQQHARAPSNPALAEMHAVQAQLRRGSPAIEMLPHQHQQLPQNIQRQQRLLSEFAQAAQAEFMRDMQSAGVEEQEHLRAEAMRRIMETERLEERMRRKAAKIAHMARYNDLMTKSDKDFITRIQVSQLVTQDPYAEDFYAQVYDAIQRSRMGLGTDERVLKFGSGGGVGLGMGQRGGGRRPNALQRMEQQVERIVQNAREREKERGLHPPDSLRGALGKTSGRSYKAAPRQLLQVDNDPASPSASMHKSKDSLSNISPARQGGLDAAKQAAKMGAEHLGTADPDGNVAQDPLTRKETLAIIENMYDLVLNLEQLRRDRPPQDSEDFELVGIWNARYNESVQQLWDGLRVMVPVEASHPHPFISLITPAKGKKLLPRVSRHLSAQQMLTMLTLLVACFAQMDVVVHAPLLDLPGDAAAQRDLERQTQTFLGSVVQSVLPVVAKAGLRLVSGLLGLLLERSDVVQISQTRPGLAFLTLFLSRVEVIKQNISSATDMSELPTQEETEQWELMFDHLFELLAHHMPYLFPSTRLALNAAAISPGAPPPAHTENLDRAVWQFLAALALHASPEQQQVLVGTLREKVLESVASAKNGWAGADEEERAARLANVNLFLHALGLDSSQIAL